jgi:hypothetical protein
LSKELEEEMAEARRQKLACFQKTRSGVVKKADTTTTSGSKVDTSPSPEDLVQLVDVSVASKYGADLTQFTRVIVEEICGTLDTFKQEMHNSLPWQVRAIVVHVRGEAQGKRVEGSPTAPGPSIATRQVNHGTLAGFDPANTWANLNPQQLFYQIVAYDPNMPLVGAARCMDWCLTCCFLGLPLLTHSTLGLTNFRKGQ